MKDELLGDIALARDGDDEAFGRLVAATHADVFTLAFRLTGNRHDAADVVQETYLRAYRSFGKFRGDAKFTTWLWSLARNTAVSELRRQRFETEVDDEMGDLSQRRISSMVANRDLVREAVYSLPPAFRETVLLRDVERLSYSEIAERQGLAINTVRSRLSRGRALLAARLPDQQIG